jgi:hypothetical protein
MREYQHPANSKGREPAGWRPSCLVADAPNGSNQDAVPSNFRSVWAALSVAW